MNKMKELTVLNTLIKQLLIWYHENKRDLPWRRTNDIYAIWLSEVMLQQTQVATVIPYYQRFLEQFPSIQALADAEEQEVLKLWEGLGYYSRVRNFHKAAKQLMSDHNGIIPRTPAAFQALPGVGPYIAAAVLSIACGVPMPAVDGNVMRVYTRLFGINDDISKTSTRTKIFKELKEVVPDGEAANFTQAFMELGALVCSPRSPNCHICPFKEECVAFKSGTIAQFPVKPRRAKVPEYNVSIAIVVKADRIYIQKRPSKGHLGGLWEFPGGKSQPGETPEQTVIRECREELGTAVEIATKLAEVRHAYSHFKICLTVFICHLIGEDVQQPEGHPFKWIAIDEIEEFPFPGANHKFFPQLKHYFTELSGNH
jgi:A/G-specific adenine glycosylase